MFFLNKWMIKAIRLYQKNDRPQRCRHVPSCSHYSLGCYEKFNFVKATFLTTSRIIRCNPFSHKIFDPVPLSKKELKHRNKYVSSVSYIDDVLLKYYEDKTHDLYDGVLFIWLDNFKNYESICETSVKEDDVLMLYAKIIRFKKLIKSKLKFLNTTSNRDYLDNYLYSNIYEKPKRQIIL